MSDKSDLKVVVVALICALAACAFAAEVVFPTVDMTGQALNRRITVTSSNAVSVVGSNLAGGVKMVLTPTNGVARTNLLLGDYTATIEGLARAWNFRVHTNGTFSVLELSNPNQLAWPQSNAVFYTRSEIDGMLAAGAGVPDWVVTNSQVSVAFGTVGANAVNISAQSTLTPDGSIINSATFSNGNFTAFSISGTGVVHRLEAGNANTLVVTNGRVGVGTANPNTQFYVVGEVYGTLGLSSGTEVRANGAYSIFHQGRNRWFSSADGEMRWTKNDGTTVLMGNTNGSLTLPGAVTANTAWGSSYVVSGDTGYIGNYGRVRQYASADGAVRWTKNDGSTLLMANTNGTLSVPADVVAKGQFVGNGAGVTNLAVADYTNAGTFTKTNFPLVEKLPNVRRTPPDWAKVPFGGFNTWYQQNSTQYPPSAFQSPTNKWVWVTNQVMWALSNNVADFYKLIVIDDTWQNTNRLANGDLWWDPAQFPNDGNNGWSGMTNVINWLHSLGFKFGLYTELDPICAADIDSTGPRLPAPGSYGYYEQDARLWSSWGVDYIKFDMQVDAESFLPETGLARFVNAWDRTGRPLYIMGSVSPKGHEGWNVDYYNEPRTPYSPDWPGYTTNDYHFHLQKHLWWGRDIQPFVRPGLFASYDILPDNMADGGASGNAYNGSTPTDFELQRAMVTMGAMMVAPRIYTRGAVSQLPNGLFLQTNRNVLGVYTDPACVGSQMVTNTHAANATVWWRPLGSSMSAVKAVALYNSQSNATPTTTRIDVCWTNLGIPSNTVYRVENLWSNEVFLATNVFSKDVRFRAAELYKMTPVIGGPVVTGVKADVRSTADLVRPNEWSVSTLTTRMTYHAPSPAPIACPDGIFGTGNSGWYHFAASIPSWVTNISGTLNVQVTNASPINLTTSFDSRWYLDNGNGAASSAYPGAWSSKVTSVSSGIRNKITFSIPCNPAEYPKLITFALSTAGADTVWVVGPLELTYQ